jgi:hypothetical protein
MMIAVCLSGQVRTFVENASCLRAMFASAAGGEDNVHYFGALHADDAAWTTLWPWQAVTLEQMESVPRYHHPALGHPVNKHFPERCLWQQWQGLMSAARLVKYHERLRGLSYDWIVRCRFDLAVLTPMEKLQELPATAIYFPKCDNWYGYNDRFCFGPSHLMHEYFRFPWSAARHLIESSQPRVAGEVLSYDHLVAAGIPVLRTRAILVTNRGNGVFDKPVCHAAHGDFPLQ